MAVEIRGSYAAGLKVDLTPGPSGVTLRTVAPVDNPGDGSSFSPTDLAAAVLGACMLTLIGIKAANDGIDLGPELAFRLEKHMSSNPRRIGRLPIVVDMPAGLTLDQRAKLERSALTCPVHRSLSHDIEIPVELRYPE